MMISVCQRPKRASSISTGLVTSDDGCLYPGVNALNGLLPFLLGRGWDYALREHNRVNALNGLLPFLRKKKWISYARSFVCQRPKRATSISTVHWIDDRQDMASCVNALNGLLPFLPLNFNRRTKYVKFHSVNALNGLLPFLLRGIKTFGTCASSVSTP